MSRHQRAGFALALLVVLTATLRAPGQPYPEPPPRLDKVPPLDARRLAGIHDDTSFGNWQHALPEEVPTAERDEDAVFWQAVGNASKVPASVFASAAADNRYLTFGHLYGEPGKYRGQVVHLEGRLVRLKRLDPPHHAQLRGISVLYEAWIYLDQPGAHPVCVVLPDKPANVEVGDGLNRRVCVDGYFFKRYRYISGRLDPKGNNSALNTLLLIAPTATLQETPPATRGSTLDAAAWWPWLGGFAAGVVILVVALTSWFRRNDRQVQARLQAVRVSMFDQ